MRKYRRSIVLLLLLLLAVSLLPACRAENKIDYPITKRDLSQWDERGYGAGEIMISAFWPPMQGFTNQTQYDYLKEANIDLLEWGGDWIFTNPDTLDATLRLCSKNGIKIIVRDQNFGDLTQKTNEELREIANRYREMDCVVGFYMQDEPLNANGFARVAQVLNQELPGAICHLNLFPLGAVPDYQGYMEDWIGVTGPDNVRYLSYDQYPFGLTEGSVPQMFTNMNLIRETGLKYGVDTGLYIQSVGVTDKFRKPTGSETRYHVSAALAYGFKNLKYFTWITPVERDEDFTNAIIRPDGSKDDIFDEIVDINRGVKKVSTILGKLDAVEIYHNGRTDAATEAFPEGWYVQPVDGKDYMVSLMTDRTTGRNYLMLVNKNFRDSAALSMRLQGIDSLEDVTEGADAAQAVALADGILTTDVEAGGFRLYRLPESLRLQGEPVYDLGANLAEGKPIYASGSVGWDGCYIYRANDGVRSSAKSGSWMLSNWSEDAPGWIMVDLLRETEINRVDLYPGGTAGSGAYGRMFPKGFRIECSGDGEQWTTVYAVEDCALPTEAVRIDFDTVQARYVRMTITACRTGSNTTTIAEMEIYLDDGTIPDPIPEM